MSRVYSMVHSTRYAWLALVLAPSTMVAYAAPATMQVWKDPNCDCCKDWITHLEKSGFATTVIEQGNSAARARFGMTQKFGSCHTALIQGYVIEGHGPAADIQPLLKDKPKALGRYQCLACPLARQAWMGLLTAADAMYIRYC